MDHAHRHSDQHSHGEAAFPGGWRAWWADQRLRAVLAGVAAAAVATLAGVVALWPGGEGRAEATARAGEIGLASERLAARVHSVTDATCPYSPAERPEVCRTVTVTPQEGPDAGRPIRLGEYNLSQPNTAPDLRVGDRLMVGYEPSTQSYFYADRDRRQLLVILAVVFAGVVVSLGRARGALALVGMALTVVVLVAFVAPAVLDGHDPVLVAAVAAAAVAFISLFLTHGVSPTTTVALAGTLCSLALTLAVTSFFFAAARFSGLASEEALALPSLVGGIDLPGLVLAGALLGALGALDDVTVTQVAAVAELHRRSPQLSRAELLSSGVRVGREHIASTVNTLLLAYAGASMPLLLIFAVSTQSLGTVANSELIAVEVVRTLCGSIGLVAAVPITTALAALLLGAPARAEHAA
ncbi:MAG: YibE/F family protein [Acidimicrobiales bacterium]